MRKRLLSLGLVCTMLFAALAGCGSEPAAQDTGGGADKPAQSDTAKPAEPASTAKRVAVCLPLRDQFITTCETLTKKALEGKGYEVTVFDANGDVSAQLSQVSACAADGYDLILVMVNQIDSTAELIDAAGDTEIVFYQRGADYDALPGKSVYIGCDQADCGDLQAKYLADYCKGKGMSEIDVVLFLGTLGNDPTVRRTDAFKKGMDEAGIKVNYVFEDTADWVREKSMDKFTQFLGTGKSYDAIVCNNDDMALGCIEALVSQGASKIEVPILGVDATEGGLLAIKDGTMAFTASQNAEGLCEATAGVVDDILNGREPEGFTDCVRYIPAIGIDQANVGEYLP
ncbi:substrate-binding domain-containing protein [Intestinibacillus massiliensis]|uniref:substrate-binding domain-containing protein n=1 Tax=Intestinibacillus massiliensis TaxID=1871029 RepID=UPI000B354512|nr:substrate-binding domain-containing protein [Intestinibacillus massiliensis]